METLNLKRAIIAQDIERNPIFRAFTLDEIENRLALSDVAIEELFERAPTYKLHQPTWNKWYLYKWNGVILRYKHPFEETNTKYVSIPADGFLVPYDYRHLRYAKVAKEMLLEKFPLLSEYKIDVYGDSKETFVYLKEHCIYFDPHIFSDDFKQLRTLQYTIEFFKPYCTMHYSCNNALAFLDTTEGIKELEKFFSILNKN